MQFPLVLELSADEPPDHGIPAGKNRVHRLCSTQRLFRVNSTKRGLNRTPGSQPMTIWWNATSPLPPRTSYG